MMCVMSIVNYKYKLDGAWKRDMYKWNRWPFINFLFLELFNCLCQTFFISLLFLLSFFFYFPSASTVANKDLPRLLQMVQPKFISPPKSLPIFHLLFLFIWISPSLFPVHVHEIYTKMSDNFNILRHRKSNH